MRKPGVPSDRQTPSAVRPIPLALRCLFALRILRASDSVMGDLLEEYAQGTRSPRWLWQQALSTFRPGADKPRDTFRGSRNQKRERKTNMLSNLIADLRYALRTLRLNPGFAATAVAAIALGVGINTGLFTILNGIALRPLAAPEANELVNIVMAQQTGNEGERIVHGSRSRFTVPEFETYRDASTTLADLAAYVPSVVVTLGSAMTGGAAQPIAGELISCNYFDLLRASPTLGPGLSGGDCQDGAIPTVVIGNDLWANQFGSDPNIIGESILLNQQSFRVVGVAGEEFQGAEVLKASFWAPLPAQPILDPLPLDMRFDDERFSWLQLLGRRQPDSSLDQVRADLDIITAQIDQQHPGRNTIVTVRTATFLSMPELRNVFMNVAMVLLAGFGLVLLIACANVANLLLARSAGRRKEIAVRLAVGASRGRLIQQLLTESVVIALLGGVLGSLFAAWSAQGILATVVAYLPAGAPALQLDTVTPDLRVLGFALAVTMLTGLVFGLAPAMEASAPDVNGTLKENTAGSGSRTVGLMRGGLVSIQVAVCMVLMISAGLLMRGVYAAQTIDPGFVTDDITVVTFDLQTAGYDVPAAVAFQRQLVERISSLPGVDQVAQATMTPLSGSNRAYFGWFEGQDEGLPIGVNQIGPGYLSMLEIPILRGRDFRPEEMQGDDTAVMVTQATANRYWPGEDPIGKTIRFSAGENATVLRTVVGVAADAQVTNVADIPDSFAYLPVAPQFQQSGSILVHGRTDFAATAAAIRSEATALDAGLIVTLARLEDNLELWRSIATLATTMSGSLAGLALLLASIGVYGVVSYTVSRRLREVGIRMMLGASGQQVMRMILRQAMKPVAIGAVVGILGSAAVSQILASVLFGVSSYDPIAFVGAALFLIAVAVVATLIPARRAMNVEPMTTLRYE